VPHVRSGQEAKGSPQADLLSGLEDETWLLNRLTYQGLDVYVDKPFDTLRDRLAHAIREYRYGPIIAGRHNGKPETYEACFERIYGVKLKDCIKPPNQKAGAA
jgi:hypothetical protein